MDALQPPIERCPLRPFNPISVASAINFVSSSAVGKLKEIFWNYGELKNGSRVAIEIEKARNKTELTTTKQLQEATIKCAPKGLENKFYAKLFQALRIEVNDELGSLKDLLNQSVELLDKGGRMVVISYHSLEDRLVKNFLKSGKRYSGSNKKRFCGK